VGTKKFVEMEQKTENIGKTAAVNEHIGEIAAVSPQKRQCEFGSYYPARTFVKPLPRQYATTLWASAYSVHYSADSVRVNLEFLRVKCGALQIYIKE